MKRLMNIMSALAIVLLCCSSAPASEGLAVKAYFDCLFSGEMQDMNHLRRITGLEEREIYRLSWLINAVRPVSAWRFRTGEIKSIRKFAGYYEIEVSLPSVAFRSSYEEWKAYDKMVSKKKKFETEKRRIPHENGKLNKQLFNNLEDRLMEELKTSIDQYGKEKQKIGFVEEKAQEAVLDSFILQEREKSLFKTITR